MLWVTLEVDSSPSVAPLFSLSELTQSLAARPSEALPRELIEFDPPESGSMKRANFKPLIVVSAVIVVLISTRWPLLFSPYRCVMLSTPEIEPDHETALSYPETPELTTVGAALGPIPSVPP